ncbi:PREDICTED: fasciclin-like arabinogalactan protein 19 [Ipomoea nil]|uniref:fasciclin-like arabinogalactan protein 19 n=1 Tax=Ipomoea nil TaxID=35883 RepID=UPI000901F83D|nr:PREDICTED: fasciclin-like arabinogalactan protein 19 [Ipomoea nil]
MTTCRRRTTLFLLKLLFLLATVAAVDSAADDADSGDPQELDAMCTVLRSSGYNLFCNAIATSDLQVQLTANATVGFSSSIKVTAGATFTLFSPKDKFLYTLDMASDAADYVAALRYHIVPSRALALSDLKSLSSPFLDTLLPHYSILIYKTDNASVTVDGVMLSDPDLYLGSKIVVHGLDGILLSGYSSPYEDCDGENESGLISSPDEVNAHHICLNFTAPTPAATPTVLRAAPTPRAPIPAARPTVLPAAPIPRAPVRAATPRVQPPPPTEKRGTVPGRSKRGQSHRQGIRSVPRRDRRRNNHTKAGVDLSVV